jgi:hypothetical protein
MSRSHSGGTIYFVACGGGDTLAIWRWQGKASRINALTLSAGSLRSLPERRLLAHHAPASLLLRPSARLAQLLFHDLSVGIARQRFHCGRHRLQRPNAAFARHARWASPLTFLSEARLVARLVESDVDIAVRSLA